MKKTKMIVVMSLLFLVFGVRIFLIDYMVISGSSMEQAYKDGEIVLIKKQNTRFQRYDVVVSKITSSTSSFSFLVKPKIIKRVIGLPGESVQIINGYVYINGNKLDDVIDIQMQYSGIAESEIKLAADEYFLLGDNRNVSEDSRYERIGIVNEKQIIGKVVFKIKRK